MTMRRGASRAITWVRANAKEARAAARMAVASGSPAAAASATIAAVIWLGSQPARARTSHSGCCSASFCSSELSGGGGDRPAGGDELELAPGDVGTVRVRDAKVADLGCPEAGAAVNPIVDDQCAADAAADGDIEEGRIAAAGTEPALGQPGCVGVVFEDDAGNSEVLADPVRQREIVPTFNLVRFLDAATAGVDRAAEADADGLDLVARRDRLSRAEAGKRP